MTNVTYSAYLMQRVVAMTGQAGVLCFVGTSARGTISALVRFMFRFLEAVLPENTLGVQGFDVFESRSSKCRHSFDTVSRCG